MNKCFCHFNGYEVKDAKARNEIKNTNIKIDDNVSALNNKIKTLNENIENGLSTISTGTPLIASSIEEMTDTSRIYVNTTDGHWYYYNGNSWVDGGIYQATEIEVDKTLTLENIPADAKTVGDTLNDINLKIMLDDKLTINSVYTENEGWKTIENWNSTPLLAIEELEGIKSLYVHSYNKNGIKIAPIVYFDVNGDLLSVIYPTIEGSENVEYELNIPSDAKYVRFSCLMDSERINPYISFKFDITYLHNKLNKTSVNNKLFLIDEFEKENTVYTENGFQTFPDWYITEFIDKDLFINSNDIKAYLEIYNKNNIRIAPITYWDEDKLFIDAVYPTIEGSNITEYFDVNIPSNAKYIRFSYKDVSGKAFVEFTQLKDFNTLEKEINKVNNDLSQVNNDINQIKNKIDVIEEDPSSHIYNVLCIGDSLTEGDYGSEPSGTANVHSENYPYYLSQYLNCNVENEGKCGYTTLNYWQNKVKNINFETNNYDVVVIMLGTNGGLTDTIEVDTEITTGQTYENYANTNTGRYCSIIEYIMEQTNNKAQIILCTPPHIGNMRSSKRAIAEASIPIVQKIGERYSLPVINMHSESGFNDYNQHIFQPIDTLHFGKYGYQKMGTFIGSKIKSMFSYFDEE